MERKFAPEGSMYRDIPTTAASTATTSGSNTRRATPINLDQNMLQNTKNETVSRFNIIVILFIGWCSALYYASCLEYCL